MKVKSLSHVGLFTTPWTAAYQAPPSMGFSRQEYWSGLPLLSPDMMPNCCLNPILETDEMYATLGIQGPGHWNICGKHWVPYPHAQTVWAFSKPISMPVISYSFPKEQGISRLCKPDVAGQRPPSLEKPAEKLRTGAGVWEVGLAGCSYHSQN